MIFQLRGGDSGVIKLRKLILSSGGVSNADRLARKMGTGDTHEIFIRDIARYRALACIISKRVSEREGSVIGIKRPLCAFEFRSEISGAFWKVRENKFESGDAFCGIFWERLIPSLEAENPRVSRDKTSRESNVQVGESLCIGRYYRVVLEIRSFGILAASAVAPAVGIFAR